MVSEGKPKSDGDRLPLRIGLLASAGLIEYGLQMLLPVVLVRYLEPDGFADYRLLWLMAATGLAVAPFFMPQSLYTLVPGSTLAERSIRVGNTFLFLTCAGLVTTFVLAAWNPLLPAAVRDLGAYFPAGAIFLALWIVGSLMDVLPTVDGRARWQSVAVVAVAVLRTVLLACAAIFTRDVELVIWGMCLIAATKVAVVWYYAAKWKPGLAFEWNLLVGQVKYAFPFAVANAFFLLRIQADQWVVVGLFSSEEFAIFSIAAVAIPLSNLVRQPINNSLLPRISEFAGKHDLAAAERAISKGYVITGAVLLPFLGLIYVSADELVELIYTERYLGAVAIMRVYLVGQVATVFASGHLLAIFRRGRTSALISAVCLVLTVVVGIAGSRAFGLIGAAAGSTLTLILGEMWALSVVARTLGAPVSRILGLSAFLRALCALVVVALVSLIARHYLFLDHSLMVRIVLQSTVFAVTWLVGIRLLGIDGVLRNILYRNPRAKA